MNKAGQHQLKGRDFPAVKSAYQAALKSAGKNDLVFVGGSTFIVAEVLMR
jgi:dihydrofolate synthase/folylpolyglutamate synthase